MKHIATNEARSDKPLGLSIRSRLETPARADREAERVTPECLIVHLAVRDRRTRVLQNTIRNVEPEQGAPGREDFNATAKLIRLHRLAARHHARERRWE